MAGHKVSSSGSLSSKNYRRCKERRTWRRFNVHSWFSPLKHTNSNSCIRFYTYWGEVVAGLPYIDEVFPTNAAPPHAIRLGYEQSIPPYAHIACVLGDSMGVDVRGIRPDCVIPSDLVQRFEKAWQALPRPHISVIAAPGLRGRSIKIGPINIGMN